MSVNLPINYYKGLDPEIAPLIIELFDAGYQVTGSCVGTGGDHLDHPFVSFSDIDKDKKADLVSAGIDFLDFREEMAKYPDLFDEYDIEDGGIYFFSDKLSPDIFFKQLREVLLSDSYNTGRVVVSDEG